MAPKLVFLVDDILPSGRIITVTDRLRDQSFNFQPNIYQRVNNLYAKYCGNLIQFMPARDFNAPEPGVKYMYFVPMNDWHWTMQQVFFMIEKDIQRKFVEHNVPIFFCQDIEMYPNMQFQFMANYFGLLELFKNAHSFPEINIVISVCALLEKNQEETLNRHFKDRIKLVVSPLQVPWTRDMVLERYASVNTEFDPRAIFKEYLTSTKQKTYMCLNRDPKFSRIMMLHSLRAHGLLEYGFVSNQFPTHYQIQFNHTDNLYFELLQRDIEKGMIPHMQVDVLPREVVEGAPNEGGTTNIIPLEHMNASCFDLVQETTTRYEDKDVVDQGVITDKIVRSLMFGRPFVVNGGPRVLEIIHKFGFKSCPYLFDERYDSESDFFKRMQMVLLQVSRWKDNTKGFMNVVRQEAANLEHNVDRVMNFPVEEMIIKSLE